MSVSSSRVSMDGSPAVQPMPAPLTGEDPQPLLSDALVEGAATATDTPTASTTTATDTASVAPEVAATSIPAASTEVTEASVSTPPAAPAVAEASEPVAAAAVTAAPPAVPAPVPEKTAPVTKVLRSEEPADELVVSAGRARSQTEQPRSMNPLFRKRSSQKMG